MKNSIRIQDDIEINFKNKNYNINLDKLLYVLSALAGEKITTRNSNEIINLMTRFNLFDETFFETIQRL